MALDQESQWVLDLVAEANRPKLNTLSPPDARAVYTGQISFSTIPDASTAR